MAEGQEKKDVTVSGKITPTAKRALDEISSASPFTPSTSKLVELSVTEYIQHHHPQGKELFPPAEAQKLHQKPKK